MKLHHPSRILLGAAAALLLGIVPWIRGDDAPPPTPAPAAEVKPAVDGASSAAPAAASAAEQPVVADKPQVEKAPEAPAAAMAPPAPAAPAESAASSTSEPVLRRLDSDEEAKPSGLNAKIHEKVRKAVERAERHRIQGHTGERVNFGTDTLVAKDERVQAAVSIAGSTTVDGDVSDGAVSIGGNTTVNGSAGDGAVSVLGSTTVNGVVGDAAVSVLGTTTINGEVKGEVVAVGGDVVLGPKAVVHGEIVSVGGAVHRAEGSVVHGEVHQVAFMRHFPDFSWLSSWAQSALFKLRLLSFAPKAAWAWLIAFVALVIYALIALLFPRGVEKCAETLETSPGYSVLTAFLLMLAMPLVFLLLAITGVGVFVIPFLALALLGCRIFGRVVMMAWFGRRFAGLLGGGVWAHPAMSVLLGGVLVMLLYTIPILALLLAVLIGFLGLGTVVYTLIRSARRAKPVTVPPAAAVAGMAVPVPALGAAEAASAVGVPPVVTSPGATVIAPAATLPRAGFWIRIAALLIDVVLCTLILVLVPFVHFGFSSFLFAPVIYGAVMWGLRATTVGGTIFHLKIVRLDDRPVDWPVAVVRMLGCILSGFAAGLGFLWIAFDPEKQAWHDKIAGTVVVQMPRNISLI
jgi:uncharacterized RDD family membrane protein YckC